MATISIGSSLDSKGFNELNEKLDKAAAKVQSTSSKLSNATKVGLASISATAGGIAGYAISATSKLEDANVQLENSFKNAGTSVEEHKGKLDKVQQQMEKFGYSGDQTRAAIARMTTVTGSADKALGSMSLAADIAKNRHLELDKAGDLLSKTMAGNMTAAKRMGIAIPESVQKIQDPAEKASAIMSILKDHFKGSAQAAAGTFGGKMEEVKAKAKDAAAAIGSKLVPLVLKLVHVTEKVVHWLGKHKEVLIALSAVVGTIVIAVLIEYTAGMIAAAAATLAATWPILLIIAIIGLLVLGVLYAWKHFAWFRTAVKAVWHAIQAAVHIAWTIIKAIFHAIVWYIRNVIVPVWKAIWHVVETVFGIVISIISGAWDIIKGVFNFIKDGVQGVIDIFGTIVGAITGAFATLGDIILAPFKWAFNMIAKIWNATAGKLHFKIPSWIPGGIGGKEFGIPKIPEWKAVGGSVNAGNPYIVGERGPELFMPGRSGTIVPNSRLGAAGGGVVQNITIVSNDPQQVVNALIRYQQRNGSIPIRTAA